MKIGKKTPEEIICDLQEKNRELEGYLSDMVGVVTALKKEIAESKKESIEKHEELYKKIVQRDKIMREQAEIIKGMAITIKEGVKTTGSAGGGLSKKDIQYILKLIHDSQPAAKQGWFDRMFKKGK